jgi:hypothetical protein
MARSWGILGVLVLTLAASACVPEPAFRRSQSPGASGDVPTITPEPTPAGPTPTISFARPTPTPGPSFTAYTVKRGDTLTKVGKKFGTSARSISYWNRVTYPSLDPESAKYRPDRLEVGWVLLLLPHKEVDPEALPTLTPKPTPPPRSTPTPTATP